MNSSQSFGPIPSEFILLGLSWIKDQKTSVSLLLLFMYLVVIVGNCTIIVLIVTDRKLHEPMHILISLLALIDLTVCSTVMPKVLAILWFGSNTITSPACLSQMYVIYAMLSFQSSLFALMSFDRYVAICHPLRHAAIMGRSFITKSLVFIVSHCTILIIPLPVLTAKLTYCEKNIIYHSFCETIEIIKLSCGDFNSITIYNIFLICFFQGNNNALIVFSYVRILRVVHMLKSPQARWKSLSTCSSHVILLSLFYISSAFPLFLFFYYPDSPLYVKTMTEILSFLLLPMINPIVYGVKTKEIQDGLRRLFSKTFVF